MRIWTNSGVPTGSVSGGSDCPQRPLQEQPEAPSLAATPRYQDRRASLDVELPTGSVKLAAARFNAASVSNGDHHTFSQRLPSHSSQLRRIPTGATWRKANGVVSPNFEASGSAALPKLEPNRAFRLQQDAPPIAGALPYGTAAQANQPVIRPLLTISSNSSSVSSASTSSPPQKASSNGHTRQPPATRTGSFSAAMPTLPVSTSSTQPPSATNSPTWSHQHTTPKALPRPTSPTRPTPTAAPASSAPSAPVTLAGSAPRAPPAASPAPLAASATPAAPAAAASKAGAGSPAKLAAPKGLSASAAARQHALQAGVSDTVPPDELAELLVHLLRMAEEQPRALPMLAVAEMQAQIGELLSTLDSAWQALAAAEAQRDSALGQIERQEGKAAQLEEQQAQLQELQQALTQQVQQALTQQVQQALTQQAQVHAQGQSRRSVLSSFPLSAPRGRPADEKGSSSDAASSLAAAHRTASMPVVPSTSFDGTTRTQLLSGSARIGSSRTLQTAASSGAPARSESGRSLAAGSKARQVPSGQHSPKQQQQQHQQLHTTSSFKQGSKVQELESELAALHAVVAAKTYEAYKLRNQLHTLQLLRDSDKLQQALKGAAEEAAHSSAGLGGNHVHAMMRSGMFGGMSGPSAAAWAAWDGGMGADGAAAGEAEAAEEEAAGPSHQELLQQAAQQVAALTEELEQQAIKRREAEQERDQAQRLLEQYKAAAARSGTLAEAGKAAAAAPAAGSPTPAAAPAADDSEAAGPQPVSSWRRRRSSTGAIYSAGSYWFGGGAAAAAAAAPEAAPPAPPAAPAAPPAVTASSPEPSGPSASSSMASSRAPARMLGGATLAGGAMYPSSPAMLPGAAAAAAAVAAAADVPPARLPPMRNISGSSTGSGRARRSSLPAYMYKGAFPNPDVQIDCRDMSYVAGMSRQESMVAREAAGSREQPVLSEQGGGVLASIRRWHLF